jgi:hypothetical protein
LTPVPNSSPGHSFPIAAIVGIAVGCIVLGVALVLGFLYFSKKRPFAKPKEATKPEDPPIEMTEYVFDGKPELDNTPMSPKPPTEIAGAAIEYYSPEKDGRRELESPGPNIVYEMPGDTPTAQELHGVGSDPNSPRSPASALSRASGTVSPVSDRGGRIVSGMTDSTIRE